MTVKKILSAKGGNVTTIEPTATLEFGIEFGRTSDRRACGAWRGSPGDRHLVGT